MLHQDVHSASLPPQDDVLVDTPIVTSQNGDVSAVINDVIGLAADIEAGEVGRHLDRPVSPDQPLDEMHQQQQPQDVATDKISEGDVEDEHQGDVRTIDEIIHDAVGE